MYLKSVLLIVANLGLLGFFVYLLRKPGRLSYCLNGPGRFTCLSAAVITLTYGLTPGFYAPAAACRFPGRLSRRYCLGPDLTWRTFHEHRCLG